MTPIGVIHSPFTEQRGTPIQGPLARQTHGEVPVVATIRSGGTSAP